MSEVKGAAMELGTERIRKLLVQYAVPAIIAMTASSLYNMVDSIFIGHGVGALAISGLALTFPLMNLAAAFGSLVGVGAATLVSMRLGQRDYETAQRILGNVVVLNLIIGISFGLLTLVFLDPILYFFGASDATIGYAREYMSVILWGNVVTHMYLGLNAVLRAAGHPRKAMYATILTVTINAILDPLFIFTFKMGVQGSSLATILSQLCSCIWIVCFFFSRKSLFRFQASLLGLSPGRIFSILSLGFTPFIMTLTECAIQIVFNINLNRATGGNKDYTAALTVMLSALQLISLPLNGLGNGMQPFVSYNYGKADSARLKQGIKYVTIIAFIYVVCIWSVSMAFPVVYARLFSASEAVTQIVMRYTPMFLMGSIMFFVQMTLQNVNVGLGQAKEALLLAVNRKVVILIPLCFALTHFLGFKGVYLSEGIADLVAGIVTAIVIFTSFPKIFRRREEEVKQAASN